MRSLCNLRAVPKLSGQLHSRWIASNVMSLTANLSDPNPTAARDGEPSPTRKPLGVSQLLLAATAVAAVLALVGVVINPIVSIWTALILIGWLFIAGAAQASGD